MEYLALFLGIICCLHLGVRSEEDATVSVRKYQIEVKPKELVSLECYGSNDQLSYYIKNRLQFAFTNNMGTRNILTSSFYPEKEFNKAFRDDVYRLDYGTVGDEFRFSLTIPEVEHADDGFYTCLLVTEKNNTERIASQKTVRVIVLNPVEKVKLTIEGIQGASSTTPVVEGDMPVKVKPGQYKVHCESTGSNPAPIMGLKYNMQEANIEVKTSNSTTGKQIKFKGAFDKDIYFDAALGVEQTLSCTSKLPNGQYPSKEAGLKLHVAIDEPDIVCKNASAKVDEKQVLLSCNISTPAGVSALDCKKVSWRISDVPPLIPATGSTAERRLSTADLDVLEAQCTTKSDRLIATLMLYHVNDKHFGKVYYIKYDKFEIPVTLYKETVHSRKDKTKTDQSYKTKKNNKKSGKTWACDDSILLKNNKKSVAAAHLIVPSVLLCIVLAIVSRLSVRTL